ncbi:hypothetical protein ACF09L_33030 [Streptomyces sp. NPDC014779]|uniref:hypothetical protein n=1 Tax=Streptomyces sp. NPDC014779 TaxID=3364911 RepID=UPI0036F598CE
MAACTSDGSDSQVEGLCGPAADSEAGKALREVLETDDFATEAMQTDERFLARFTKDLKEWGGKDSTSPSYLCTFVPADDEKKSVVLSYAWSPAEEPQEKTAKGGATLYDVNGATGEPGHLGTTLYVTCRMPGELGENSKKAVLRADASLTVNRGKEVTKALEERQLSALYLMTRGVTDALGCENKPLDKAPVVKPSTRGAAS